ncbi:LAMI_0H12618g1_1 [Lachancea mirantina]|uniref:LAMI_0H12618g1_1 n=1 Tax=Lachancea mirantina TaxID=1230905 RepID=A0A1G4KHF9_9SACH|nr:LAMI_0H12618g1_1 [Lachancea mirantina]
MVTHFGELKQHRLYVLHWYRYTLRNTTKYVESEHLKLRLRTIVKSQLFKHRTDKSSWSAYISLQKLRELNKCLTKRKTIKAWNLLTEVSEKSQNRRTSMQSVSNVPNAPVRPVLAKESTILNHFIAGKQAKGLLPKVIPQQYKTQLLLPLALHDMALARLHREELKLARGPPKTYLNYTNAGRSRIWFVRSALNKSSRQSKSLGIMIRKEKKWAQGVLDARKRCEEDCVWAWQEALWEELLDSGRLVQGNPIEYVFENNSNFGKFGPLKNVTDWLNPIRDCVRGLELEAQHHALRFKKFKDDVLGRKSWQYFQTKSDELYARRLSRYRAMARRDLSKVTPFVARRSLPSILDKYHF